MSADACHEVIEILEMHRVLRRSCDHLANKTEHIDEQDVDFRQFDSNQGHRSVRMPGFSLGMPVQATLSSAYSTA
jgi:uncharacterized protein YfbU (UPF0304 family)